MFSCSFCSKPIKTLRGYVLHCKLHRNEPRCLFKCFGAGCKQTFCRYQAFKAHFYRRHNMSPANVTVMSDITAFKCAVALCERQCKDIKDLIMHLKEHIMEGRVVTCPVRGCTNTFKVKSSFTAHMSRKHRDFAGHSVSDLYRESVTQSTSVPAESDEFDPQVYETCTNTGPDEGDLDGSENFSDLFLRNVCLFYLKLQGHFLLPVSTIQNIVEEMQNIHELGQTYTLSKLTLLLKEETSLSDQDITKICESIRGFDVFSTCHKGPMRTAYSRAQSFKQIFNYVEPTKIFLGSDENRSDRFAYYVPLRETLKCVLESDLWQKCVSREHSSESPSDILNDITDGQIFQSNVFGLLLLSNYFCSTEQSTEIHSQSALSSPTSSTPSSHSSSPLPSCPITAPDWVDSFQIPLEKFPEALMQCLERGKRPSPRLRREMVRIVVTEMMKICASPSKRASTQFAKKMVAKYPQSLQDVIEGDVVGPGYHSLVKQLQARIENVKRSSAPRIMKRKQRSDEYDTDEVPAEQRAAVQDTYGCIQWEMKFLPVSETPESQKDKKDKMKVLYDQTNFSPDEEIGMTVHFQELTGVSLKETFLNSVQKKGKRLLDFMRTICSDKNKRVLQTVMKLTFLRGQLEGCSEDVKDMVLLLLSYFREKEETLLHYVEETCLAHEVQVESLPVTPCIIVCGTSCYTSRQFMVCVDRKIMNGQIPTFISALCLMFGSYYCLNIHYPVELASTLEFLQRCFFNINPEKGTKVETTTKKKHLAVNPRVLTLIADLSDHEWRETC
ncbi:uncharacterized protein LOC143525314 isoform X2 [Brachyhypopomus gauderio]|uniref:uncharacterized protein LOC143525314 isoform X2 n=1 Tax=Brachyhypopomus gauderio TaxID=698409 RepID=UPI004041D2CA